MPLVVNTNVMSLNAQRHLTMNTNSLSKSLEKLASGYRINRAGDDAAGLQLSENLRAQIRGSKKALGNVQDGVNVLNIADGALASITENLQRMRELVVQASNDTYDGDQRDAMQAEVDQLVADIDRIADSTQFNGVFLLDDSANGAGAFTLHIGANDTANDTLDLGAEGVFAGSDATDLGVNAITIDNTAAHDPVPANDDFIQALVDIDAALTQVNGQRGDIGAVVNRLEGAATNLMTSIENLSSSESRIRDVDVAAESAEMIRNQILQQSAATVLAQANQSPSLALSLLGG